MWAKEPKSEREKYLEYELDRYREQEEQRYREALRERAAREQEWQCNFEKRQHTADTWPEALRKAIWLFRHESLDEADLESFWEESARACECALTIWKRTEQLKQAEIGALEAQIAAIRQGIRLDTAEQLETKMPGSEAKAVANALRTMTPEDLLYW